MALTRALWRPDCTFETAIGAICEASANALRIDRVSVWRYDVPGQRLHCIHSYDGASGGHRPVALLEVLSLEGDDYIAALADVRTFETSEIQDEPAAANSHQALRDYLQRHRIHAVLDAPAFVGGELHGVICHESIQGARIWSREETTFAASMGDYVAMAYEIARRHVAEAEIDYLRVHDAATGLPNRDYMIELIRQRLLAQSPHDAVPAVVNLRVDAAQSVAMSLGTTSEDEVMAR
ncbi:MAG: GAF domain-containing protein, partial [Arenimonas sp.]|uniref:GAF domain-containing protein n=1 Tax=Arenimonas sp. TaxID=1872635 RepID=UPI0025BEB8E3